MQNTWRGSRSLDMSQIVNYLTEAVSLVDSRQYNKVDRQMGNHRATVVPTATAVS